jgi:hypothetical protein
MENREGATCFGTAGGQAVRCLPNLSSRGHPSSSKLLSHLRIFDLTLSPLTPSFSACPNWAE